MSFQQTLSGFRKKAKEKLSKIGHNAEKRRTNVGGKVFHRSAPASQLEPDVAAEGELSGDTKFNAGEDSPRPGDPLSASQSVVGSGPSDDKANATEIGQKYLHPHSHAQSEGGPSREGGGFDEKRVSQAHPPLQPDIANAETLVPSIPPGVESDSTRTTPFQSPPLTDDAGNPAFPDPVDVDTTGPKDKPDWKQTTSSTAKLFLRTVERVSDVFPPLKSVSAGLCTILDNCEVRFAFGHLLALVFTVSVANVRQQTNTGIIGFSSRNACQFALRTYFQR